MYSKKLLTFDKTYFNLPDDFEGNIVNAIRLMADYFEQNKKYYTTVNFADPIVGEPAITADDNYRTLFGQDNKKIIGEVSLSELDDDNNWVHIKPTE